MCHAMKGKDRRRLLFPRESFPFKVSCVNFFKNFVRVSLRRIIISVIFELSPKFGPK